MFDKVRKSSGLQVFLATMLGYALAFFYEVGYLNFYGVSSNFVQIKPLQVISGVIVALITSAIYDILFALIDPRNRSTPRKYFDLVTFVLVLIGVTIGVISSAYIHGGVHQLELWGGCVLGIIFIDVVAFLPAIVSRIRGSSWDDALTSHIEQTRNRADALHRKPNPETEVVLYLRLIPELLLATMLVGSALFGSYAFGKYSAQYDNKFMTIVVGNKSQEQIVIRDYGDQLITKPFDTKTKQLKPGFSIISATGENLRPAVLKCTHDFIATSTRNQTNLSVLASCPR